MVALARILRASLWISSLVLSAHPLFADQSSRCATIAQRVVSETPGQLLSVTARRDRCQVVYLIQRDGQRARRVVFDLENSIRDLIDQRDKRPGRGLVIPVQE
jgi:hypothetical protein